MIDGDIDIDGVNDGVGVKDGVIDGDIDIDGVMDGVMDGVGVKDGVTDGVITPKHWTSISKHNVS